MATLLVAPVARGQTTATGQPAAVAAPTVQPDAAAPVPTVTDGAEQTLAATPAPGEAAAEAGPPAAAAAEAPVVQSEQPAVPAAADPVAPSAAPVSTSAAVAAEKPADASEAMLFQDVSGISLDELLKLKTEAVWSASKRAQLQSEAAADVIVITGKDIRLTGATNIGDVLRSIAGIDVREAHAGQHVIGIRGFADTTHVLVTIDGNNAFMYHANHVFFDWIPVSLEEIERIEIIKGPGSILYGGSAFSGVINIYTKAPGESQGTRVALTGGSGSTLRTGAGHGGTVGSFDYSLTAERYQANEWEDGDIAQEFNSFAVTRGALAGRYRFDDISGVSLALRHSEASHVISRVCEPSTTMLSARYERPNFWARGFIGRHEKTFWGETFRVGDWNHELEALYSNSWDGTGFNDTLSIGGSFRYTRWYVGLVDETKGVADEKHHVFEGALTAENELRLNDWIVFNVGGRLAYYSMLDLIYSGRGALVFRLAEGHSLRATVAAGYYLPSLFEHTNEGTVYPFALGNKDLKQSRITSYQLSYTAKPAKVLSVTTGLFYNFYTDLIDDSQSGPQKNIADAQQYGGEIETRFGTEQAYGFANYAYQFIDRGDYGTLPVDPRHKLNFGMTFALSRWTFSGTYHLVDTYYEQYLTSNPVFGRTSNGPDLVEAYNTIDARLAFRPDERFEVYLAGSNVFDNRHYESNSGDWHSGDQIGRRVTGGINAQF